MSTSSLFSLASKLGLGNLTRPKFSLLSGSHRLIPTRLARQVSSKTDDSSDENGEGDVSLFDRDFVDMRPDDFEELYKDDTKKRYDIETIINEYNYQKYNSIGRVPSVISIPEMRLLLEDGTSSSKRLCLLNFFFKREMLRLNAAAKKANRTNKLVLKYGEEMVSRTGLLDENSRLMYGLWHNCLFSRIPDGKLKYPAIKSRLINAALDGPKIIFDFDFDEYMNSHTRRSISNQLRDSIGTNNHPDYDPFDIWFCNYKKSMKSLEFLDKLSPNSLITYKEDCFTNYFDKSRLIYLSPNALAPLTDFHQSDSICIIGYYNDKGGSMPLTMRKAQSLGIKARRLPLDEHVVWGVGTKSLCLNHVLEMLLKVRANGGDWRSAIIETVPSRKIKSLEEIRQEEEFRRVKWSKKMSLMKKGNRYSEYISDR